MVRVMGSGCLGQQLNILIFPLPGWVWLVARHSPPRTATRTQGTGAPSKGSISSAARCCAPHGTAPCGRNVGVRRMGGWGARGHATSPGGAPAPPLRGTPRVSGPERARVSPRKWH
eukprot:gene686-biopygen4658